MRLGPRDKLAALSIIVEAGALAPQSTIKNDGSEQVRREHALPSWFTPITPLLGKRPDRTQLAFSYHHDKECLSKLRLGRFPEVLGFNGATVMAENLTN